MMVVMFVSARNAAGDVPRWRFEQGQTLYFEVSQTTTTESGEGESRLKGARNLTINYQWRVGNVDASGRAQVELRLTRIRAELTGSQIESVEYDSKESKVASAMIRQAMLLYAPLLNERISIIVAPNGRVVKGTVPNRVRDKLTAVLPAPALDAALSPTGITRLCGLEACQAPDDTNASATHWTNQSSAAGSAVPGAIISYKCRQSASELQDIESIGSYVFTSAIEYPPAAAEIQVTIVEQTGSGEFRFDSEQGRLVDLNEVTSYLYRYSVADESFDQRVNTTLQLSVSADPPA